MAGLHREEQLGERKPSPAPRLEKYRVGVGYTSQKGSVTSKHSIRFPMLHRHLSHLSQA